jgi:hypothetical protein
MGDGLIRTLRARLMLIIAGAAIPAIDAIAKRLLRKRLPKYLE